MRADLVFTLHGCTINATTGEVFGMRGARIGCDNTHGYESVAIGGVSRLAHRVIWECVNGPIPAGLQINHINGVKRDNRIANLEMVTASENIRHSFRTGLQSTAGERHPCAKLTTTDVLAIRASVEPSDVLAARFGVSRATIRQIITRHTWRNVP